MTGMQLSRLPVLHLGATSGCAVMYTFVEESSLQARTQARKHTHAHTVEFRARWSTLAPSVHGRRAAVGGRLAVGSGVLGWVCAPGATPEAWEGKWEPGAAQPHYWWCWVAGGGGGLVIRKECERGEAEQQHE